MVVLDNATGGILALVGGRDFAHSAYDRAVSARRPAGTAFKPLVYAAAFEKGFHPGTLVQDAVIDNRQVMIGGTTGILGEWGPERVDNKYEGAITARARAGEIEERRDRAARDDDRPRSRAAAGQDAPASRARCGHFPRPFSAAAR